MDRLGELKEMRQAIKGIDRGAEPPLWEWCISEIEQLRKALKVVDEVTWRDRMTKDALIDDIVDIRNIARKALKGGK